jgi:hypothetical protein
VIKNFFKASNLYDQKCIGCDYVFSQQEMPTRDDKEYNPNGSLKIKPENMYFYICNLNDKLSFWHVVECSWGTGYCSTRLLSDNCFDTKEAAENWKEELLKKLEEAKKD